MSNDWRSSYVGRRFEGSRGWTKGLVVSDKECCIQP